MRFALCVLLLAVCTVTLQCTANATDNPQGGDQKSEGSENAIVATTTTTAAQKISAPDVTIENSERGSSAGGEMQPDPDAAAMSEPVPVAADEVEKTITTTTAVNVVSPQVDNQLDNVKNPDKDASAPKPEDGSAGKEKDADQLPPVVEPPPEAAPVRAEAKAAAPQTTTTTTASVNSLPLSDNSQSREQTSRTTTVVQTNSSPPSTREREVAPHGPEPGKKNVGAPAKTPGDQTISQERGAHASVPVVKDSAVTPPTSIAKKNNGADAGLQPNKNSEDKGTQQKKTPDATTTITEEQKASTETSTTSSAAPTKETSPAMTSTLPKGFKIPQSVDKTDGIGSVSLWFAFATLFMFAVTAVTPVH